MTLGNFNGFDLAEYVRPESPQVHVFSQIDGNVTIGPRTRVWQFASVIRGSIIGADCSIASCAIVDGAAVGDGTIISHGAFIDPGVVIGKGVFIGPNVSICNDKWPRADKDGFDMEALISRKFVTVSIGDGASVGANVVVLPGIKIGRGAMIAAGTVVDCHVPDWHLFRSSAGIEPIDISRKPTRMRQVA